MQSETADNIVWGRFSSGSVSQSAEVTSALDRIKFMAEMTSRPLHRMIELASSEGTLHNRSLIVVLGRSRRLAVESHTAELREIVSEQNAFMGSEAPKTLGDVAAAFVATGLNANLLVLQACP